jgi:large subunit ribosomal protein L23
MKDPYSVIKKRLITEKSKVLEDLQHKASNRSIARCKSPKYVFLVDTGANKNDIAVAIEEIYKEQGIKVTKVNTLHTKAKVKRRGRGRPGNTTLCKKAIVTLEEGNSLEGKV